MKNYIKLGLSVKPKAHIFEDHAIESMQDLNDLDDKTKYFIELSHQDGAIKDIQTQGLREYKQEHESQHKYVHRSSQPKVHEVKEK